MLFYVLILCSLSTVTGYANPPQAFEASEYTTWLKNFEASRLAEINVPFIDINGLPDTVSLKRLDLVGDEYNRGLAHGALMAMEILEFVTIKLPVYYADIVLKLDVSMLPEFLQLKIKKFGLKGFNCLDCYLHKLSILI